MLTQARKDALQAYLNKGGNFIGIHSATDCLNTTAFYGKEVGAFFDYHPDLQDAVSIFIDVWPWNYLRRCHRPST